MYSPNQLFLILDYETYSEADLKKVGAFEYSLHASTEVLCASFRLGTRASLPQAKVKTYAPLRNWNMNTPELRRHNELLSHLQNPNVIIVAHNARFEQAITRNVFCRHVRKLLNFDGPLILPHKRFICTAALAQVHALPRSLDGACQALSLPHQKDKEGHRLMLKWAKPRKPTKNNPAVRHSCEIEFVRMVKYCERDILAGTSLFLKLPPLIPSERALWEFDQKINFRGVLVDRDLVSKIIRMIEEEKKLLTVRLRFLTNGFVQTGGQTLVILNWLKGRGIILENLQKKTVEDAIIDGLASGIEKEVLEIRLLLNKTSLKKYPNFLNHTTSDSRLRFSLNFHAASTGRWGGAGVQPHNFPRGTLKYKNLKGEEIDLAPFAAQLIKDGADIEFLRIMFNSPIEVFVSCLRTVLTASPGNELFVADYAAIEARILFWVADHFEGCKAFAEGRKMYEEMAMLIYNISDILRVSKDERFVGKEAILGSGFGMGWKKFQIECKKKGREIETSVAKGAIRSYREKHKPVVELWRNLEKAAVSAVENPNRTFKTNHTEWFMLNNFLQCKLPSGRCLYYYKPQIAYERTPWGATQAVLYHWGVDSKTKKWVLQKTWGGVLTENVVQAIARDLLAFAMLAHEAAGFKVLLTVHDEIIAQQKIGAGDLTEFCDIMKRLPTWAHGAPVNVEGWKGLRYRK